MEQQHLQFKIGAVFSGEGFAKLKQEVNTANQNVGKAASAAQKAAGALGQLDTSGSKAASAVSGLVQALMSGGVQGALFAGAMMAINAYLSKMKEELAEAQKRVEALKASVREAFVNVTNDIKGGFTKEITEISTKFDLITKNAQAFTNALTGLASSNGAGNVINLEIEKYNAMLAEGTAEGAKRVEALYNLRIAEEKAATVEIEQKAKVENATTARVQAEAKLVAIREESEKLGAEVARVEEAYRDAVENGTDNRKDLAKFLADLKSKQEDLAKKEEQTRQDVINLTVAEQTAIQNQTNAINEAKLSTMKASDAYEKASVEITDASNAFVEEYEKRQEAEALKEAEQEMADVLKEHAEAERGSKDAATNLKEAQQRLTEAIRAYEDNIAQNKVNETVQASVNAGNGQLANMWGDLIEQRGEIQKAAGEVAVQRGLENGQIRTVAQMNQARREAAQAANAEINSKQTNQMIQEENRAQRLQNLIDKGHEKMLSKDDKKFMEDRQKAKDARDKQAKDVADAKKALEDAKKLDNEAKQAVIDIKKKMDNLGLK